MTDLGPLPDNTRIITAPKDIDTEQREMRRKRDNVTVIPDYVIGSDELLHEVDEEDLDDDWTLPQCQPGRAEDEECEACQ